MHLDQTFSEKDANFSDRDTSISEIDTENSVSDRDTYRQCINIANSNKSIIYDTDEEPEDVEQQRKRQRKNTTRESSINPIDNQRLKNIKSNLFAILKDKDTNKKFTLEFKERMECEESQTSLPGFDSIYAVNAPTYDEILNVMTPSKSRNQSESSEEDVALK